MLGLNEPGSDLIAAATLLKNNPDARDTLQIIADLRAVDGFKDGPAGLARYGMECRDAVEYALSLPPEQLKTASIETLHAIAVEYDQKNALNRSLGQESPEGKVYLALENAINGERNESLLRRTWDAAVNRMPEDPSHSDTLRLMRFTPEAIKSNLQTLSGLDGETRQIADHTIEAIDRLDAVAGETPHEPPVQTPQIKFAAPPMP